MTTDTAEQFPVIPEDVERLIVEYAAETDRMMSLQLVCVCRQYQRWVDPIIYRVVKLPSSETLQDFLFTLRSSKPPSFFATHVKILALRDETTIEEAYEIISICAGVMSLLYWRTWYPGDEPLSPTISSCTTLQKLSFDIRHFTGKPNLNFELPILQNVTHLDIFGFSASWCTWPWEAFARLVHLSHLFLEYGVSDNLNKMVSSLLPYFPDNLRVCIVFLDIISDEVEQMALGKVDSRIVLGTQNNIQGFACEGIVILRDFDDIFEDWACPVDNKVDIWKHAEDIIRDRQKKSGAVTVPAHAKSS